MSNSNYVLFSAEGKICRYATEIDILKEFFQLRAELYDQRKKFMLAKLKRDLEIL